MPENPGGAVTHPAGEGPLSVAGSGGSSILAPRTVPWVATFGWAYPCTTTGEPITIERIRYRFKARPRSFRSLVFEAERWRGATGFGSTKGTPEVNLARGDVRGELLGDAEGFVVTEPCGKASPDRLLQILTVLEVGARGGEVSDYAIDYSTGTGEYSLKVDFQLVACGTQTSPDMC